MKSSVQRMRVGEIRPSQLLFAFGVGSIVDLPNMSVMVMGLEDWPLAHAIEITEERLLAAVAERLGAQVEKLLAPPIPPEDVYTTGPLDPSALVGVPVAPFPRWMLCLSCRLLAPLGSGLFQLKLDAYRPDRHRFVHTSCPRLGKPPTVVPARFLIACRKGHLDDFPWVEFVHQGPTDCKARLRFFEVGPSGEATDVIVKCEVCNNSMTMARAFGEEGKITLPQCRGRRPHLRDFEDGGCDVKPVTAILMGASNSWFPISLSALSIPTGGDKLAQLVEQEWAVLGKAASLQNIELLLQIGQLRSLAGFSAAEIWGAVQRKNTVANESSEEVHDLKLPEWRVFSNPDPTRNSRDFMLRAVAPPAGYEALIEQVVLIERLREVRALVGFTRLDSPGDYSGLGELPDAERAPLSRRAPSWVPTTQVRGEGIFVRFSEPAMQAWVKRARGREGEFTHAHRAWRGARHLDPDAGYPGLRFVLLHSFAHALLRQLALECGYTTASIRERIYSRLEGEEDGPMAGLLLYTAAPDSEGTLGGLVSLGEPRTFGRHLDQALECMRLCASDPLCAEHAPTQDGLTLHGAACHACLFAPETSCERGNKYLDRAVLVETVEQGDIAFFPSRERRAYPVPPEPGADEELPLVAEPPEGEQPRRPRSA